MKEKYLIINALQTTRQLTYDIQSGEFLKASNNRLLLNHYIDELLKIRRTKIK